MDPLIKSLDKLDKPGIVYRLILFFVNSLFLSTVPLFAFLLFMGENKFFSYDVIVDSLFALNVFVFIAVLLFLIISFVLCGSVVFFVALFYSNGKQTRPLYILLALVFLVINIAMQYNLAEILINENDTLDYMWFFSTLGVPVFLHIGAVIWAKPKFQLTTLFFMVVICYTSLIAHIKVTNDLITTGLARFGVGGGLAIIVEDRVDRRIKLAQGTLIFMSPENLYISENNKVKGLTIIERSKDILIVISYEG